MNVDNELNSSVRSAGDDPALTALLRSTYAAPTDSAYWAGLEQRVLTRLRESGPVAWWAVFSEWRVAGMVAAAAVLFVAGATAVHEQQINKASRDEAAAAAAFTVFDSTSDPINIAISSPSDRDKRALLAYPPRYLDLIRP